MKHVIEAELSIKEISLYIFAINLLKQNILGILQLLQILHSKQLLSCKRKCADCTTLFYIFTTSNYSLKLLTLSNLLFASSNLVLPASAFHSNAQSFLSSSTTL